MVNRNIIYIATVIIIVAIGSVEYFFAMSDPIQQTCTCTSNSGGVTVTNTTSVTLASTPVCGANQTRLQAFEFGFGIMLIAGVAYTLILGLSAAGRIADLEHENKELRHES